MCFKSYILPILAFLFAVPVANGQYTDSWESVLANKGGNITALWYNIHPFIFTDNEGRLQGVEYELMESFTRWLADRYGCNVKIHWKGAASFEQIYEQIKEAHTGGLFGWSFYSITPGRKREVRFTPPYMPDINVLVTHEAMPLFLAQSALLDTLPYLQGYTMRHTAMEEDIDQLIGNRTVPVSRQYDDYETLQRISREPNAFGYVPLAVYVVSLQKGIKVKRQHLFSTEREGLAGIFPLNSDWHGVIGEYFESRECAELVQGLLAKYLGPEISALIAKGPGAAGTERSPEMELLAREREIVTQRLVNSALAAERDRTLRNISIGIVVMAGIILGLLYNRYRIKLRMSRLLQQRNLMVAQQKQHMQEINRKLHSRVLQSQVNPRFFFNSLNDLQHFIHKGEQKTSLHYLSRVSRFTREFLSQASEPEITLAREVKLLDLYLRLEQTRFTGRFDFVIRTNDLVAEQLNGLPPLVIYHYVENALYFGILPKEEKGFIDISFDQQAGYLVCTVTDNGCGRKEAEALKNKCDLNESAPYKKLLEERLMILNEEKQDRIEVTVRDLVQTNGRPAGTQAQIRMLVQPTGAVPSDSLHV